MTQSFIGNDPADPSGVLALVQAKGGDTKDTPQLVQAINEDAAKVGLRARALVAVLEHETDGQRSPRYRSWRNPGGIAISSGTSVEVWRPYVPTYREVSAMLVAAFAQKVYRRSFEAELPLAYQVPGMKDWLARSLSFTNDRFYPDSTVTTTDMIQDFEDDTGELQYVWAEDQQWAAGVENWLSVIPKGKNEPMTELVFKRVKHPPFVDRLIPDSENGAYDDLGTPKLVGACQHSMIGTLWGTDGWFRRGRIGPNRSTGLTHYGIGNTSDGTANDGLIIRWNDPTGKAHSVDYTDSNGRRHKGPVSARRAGWANGGSDGLEGDGPLFVRTLGVSAINRDLVSIERSDGGNTEAPMSPKQFESICALSAYWFDQCGVPWDRFPLNPKVGIVTHLLHFEFATKACPFTPVRSNIDRIQDRIRAILKAGQTAVVDPSVPPVDPPKPQHDKWPYPVDQLRERFGKLPIRQPDGTIRLYSFSETNELSNAWAQRAKADKIKKVADIPPPLAGFEVKDSDGLTQTIITFDGRGRDAWVLFRPAKQVGYHWAA